MKLGKNLSDIQKSNRCIVFESLLNDGPISRVDLARNTGLNKATITNIIQSFINRGIVKDVGSINASNGRKVAGLSLSINSVVSIIIRIQANQIIFCTSDFDGEVNNYVTVPYYSDDETPDKVIEIILEHTDQIIEICKAQNKKILGISIATLGWLFQDKGTYIIKADIASVLEKIELKSFFEQHYPDYFVYIEHDAKVSSLAEWDYYCKNEEHTPTSMLNIVADVGFGGGIIINGEVFSGFNGIAGEVGHMGINPASGSFIPRKGILNYGGLFEDHASPLALQHRVVENLPEFPKSILSTKSTIEEIYDAYEAGDSLAEFCVSKMARYLAYGLTGIIFILNPEVIVLGDKMIRSDKFYKQLNTYLEMFLPKEIFHVTKIRFSAYQDKGVLLGANIALLKHFIKTKKLFDFLNLEYQ